MHNTLEITQGSYHIVDNTDVSAVLHKFDFFGAFNNVLGLTTHNKYWSFSTEYHKISIYKSIK